MKILLTGANGQVGWELSRSLAALGDVVALKREQCDLNKPSLLPGLVREVEPDVIVNGAAYTAVDQAETNELEAMRINAESVEVLAREAKRLNALFVHYSTDYVFDGKKSTPYTETDTVCPINVYGRSKLEGEKGVARVAGDYLIFRTSWVYASRGRNFLRTIIKLAYEREEIHVVSDQFGAPTWARDIANTTRIAVSQYLYEKRLGEFHSGIYNLTSSGMTSWYGFAKYILERYEQFGDKKDTLKFRDIKPIPSCSYPTPAARPEFSSLNVEKLERWLKVSMPSWEEACDLCVKEFLSESN